MGIALGALPVVLLVADALWRWTTAGGIPAERPFLPILTELAAGVGVALYLGWHWMTATARRVPGQVTRRFARAVGRLGSSRPETRLEAIQVLAAIARDSARYARPVADILATYVRERSPWLPAELPAILKRPAEIRASMSALGGLERRRVKGDTPLNLARVDLRELKLTGLNLGRVNLTQANLERADLSRACLNDAILRKARLGGARLQGASLRRADLTDADLRWADLARADLRDALGLPLSVDALARTEKGDPLLETPA